VALRVFCAWIMVWYCVWLVMDIPVIVFGFPRHGVTRTANRRVHAEEVTQNQRKT